MAIDYAKYQSERAILNRLADEAGVRRQRGSLSQKHPRAFAERLLLCGGEDAALELMRSEAEAAAHFLRFYDIAYHALQEGFVRDFVGVVPAHCLFYRSASLVIELIDYESDHTTGQKDAG